MKKYVLLLAAVFSIGCSSAKAQSVGNRTTITTSEDGNRASDIADVIIKAFPGHNIDRATALKLADTTLKQSDLMMDLTENEVNAIDFGAFEQYEVLIKIYLKSLGITDEEYEYFKTTILPLYYYMMKDRNVPANADIDFQLDTIAAAPKDGCYFSVGNLVNTYNPGGIDCDVCRNQKMYSDIEDPTSPIVNGKPKTNGAYPWGLVRSGSKIFWGTVNNILCMPSWQSMTSLGTNAPYENKCWVCEYDKGVRKDAGKSGDIVRPRVYMYDMNTGYTKDITPANAAVLDDCLGLRSAAAHNGVVFIGGPGLDSDGGQTSTTSAFLAFDEDGKLLATSDMQDIDGCRVTDVRRWLVHEGVLYVGVAITDQNGVNKGAILRWYGDKNNPFNFHIVGYTANEAGEICFHNGRIYAGGWPTDNYPKSAIFESPIVPEGGLTPDAAIEWDVKWSIDQYEPNLVIQRMNQCSLLRSYKGKLYWSMWFTQYALPSVISGFGFSINDIKGMGAMLALMRQATLWRTDDFSEVEMLYGEENLPNLNLMTREVVQPMPNVSGYKPVYGRAGFDRLFTSYMWASAEYNGDLYIGTMTTEGVIEPGLESIAKGGNASKASFLVTLLGVKEENKGYELYRFRDNNSPAETVTQDGFGNHDQYGIRNIVLSEDGSDMYIGTASPFNLKEYGGWRILKYHDNDFDPTTAISDNRVVKAGVLMREENGYVVLSSMLNERIKNVTVTDLAGRVISSETPVNYEAYLFPQVIGTGVFIVTVTTESGSWTTKVAL